MASELDQLDAKRSCQNGAAGERGSKSSRASATELST
jgi:hypothetical protein